MKNYRSFISDQVPANASLIFYVIVIVLFHQLEAIQPPPSPAIVAPLVASYNDKLRPLLDAVDQLRRLRVTQEGISLPTIVVVGDQSSGKSSVLESLARISLPRGQGICTRVPLIMRLQHHSTSMPEIQLEYQGKFVRVDEDKIAEAITLATDEIAGNGKGISNVPITLVVKKSGVPDLTLIDLPGITRVPVHGQPENIYEQISDEYTDISFLFQLAKVIMIIEEIT
nr:dynamin superfamily [Tanacetum cinerariifolium]